MSVCVSEWGVPSSLYWIVEEEKEVISCSMGWSDFHLFCDFRKWAHCYRLAVFLWVQFPKIRQILQPLKVLNTKCLLLNLGLQAKFSEPCAKRKKQKIKVKFWIWCPKTVYYNMSCAQIFFKNHSTLLPNIYIWRDNQLNELH